MLALASELSTLETDPGALGKRYQLTATLPPSDAARVARIPGVQAAAPRYEVEAADAFALGETINVIAFSGDHTRFEAPALVSGRRLRGSREAEVGQGLAQALGLTARLDLGLWRFRPAGRSDCASSGSSARCSTTAGSPTSRHPRCWPRTRARRR